MNIEQDISNWDDPFGEFIYCRTYARWDDEKQRREKWDETVGRYRNYFLDRFELPLEMESKFNHACDMILDKEVVPSMRCLWTAGKALDVESMCSYNCFSGETEIITFDNGAMTIQNAVGDVRLLDVNGDWVESVVKSFGTQTTIQAKFGYNTHNKSYRVTRDHEWILEDGVRVTTDELVNGDKIKFNMYPRKKFYDNIDYKLGLIHGIIYADGTSRYKQQVCAENCVSQRRLNGYSIRICGDHDDILPIFEGYARSYPPSCNGDPIVYLWDNFAKTHQLKDLPSGEYETEDYLVGFIRGWLAGDGYVSKPGQVSVACPEEGVEWLKKYAPRIGYLVQSLKKFPDETNYGTRKKSLFNVYFNRKCIIPEDMIIKRKRDRLKPMANTFTFRGIIPNSDRQEEVFCAVVPDTHSFTLADGMVTGNCTAILIDSVKSWADMMYLLLNGCGVGYSVERQVINKLPEVPSEFVDIDKVVVFEDSKIGWAEGLLEYLNTIYDGGMPEYDLSPIRPKGERLKTFGGRAGGSDDLRMLLDYIKVLFTKAKGRQLTSLECHDLCCFIANVVVSAGIRRSACISLSNLSDPRIRDCKVGEFWLTNPQRQLANNSVAYTEKPDMRIFMQEWTSLMNSGSGERGIFNRESSLKQFKELGRRTTDDNGIELVIVPNPCAEILLRPNQACNLTEVIVRPKDTLKMLLDKVEAATVLGCMQSCLTDIHFLDDDWKENMEEERLLGVSLTGVRDHEVLNKTTQLASMWLGVMREHAHQVAEKCATVLGINKPIAITCIKPSGCRPWWALTTTDQGLLTMEELFEDHPSDQVWADVERDIYAVQGDDSSKITRTFANGVEDVYAIQMNNRLTVHSTADHKWYVKYHYTKNIRNKYVPVDRWIRTKDLCKEDIIDVNIGVYNKHTHSKMINMLPLSVNMRNPEHTKFPEEMNGDLAWLLGYLWGDGAMSPSKYRIRFTDQHIDHLNKVNRIVYEQFGITCNILPASEGRDASVIDIPSKNLWHWLIKNNVWKYYNDHIDVIPNVVRTSSKDDIIAFIAGMIDADGNVQRIDTGGGYARVGLSTADKWLSDHIQRVGWAVGLTFGRSINRGGYNFQCINGRKEMYLMSITQEADPISMETLEMYSCKMQNAIKSGICNGWFTNNDLKNKKTPGKVLSVRCIGKYETYDIETDNNWFYDGIVKSHNTVSALLNTASGVHTRFSPYYIRRVRVSTTDVLCEFLVAEGVPHHPEVGQDDATANTRVFDFPIKAPEDAIFDTSALEQLEYWRMFKTCFTDHNPSVTIMIEEDEWLSVGSWVYKNWNIVGGLSFLPKSDHIYQLAPFEAITEEEYDQRVLDMPDIDFDKLTDFEREDETVGGQTLACVGGNCEVI